MLNQDVRTFLAAGAAGIGQWSQTPGIAAPHIHPVLQEKAYSQLAYVEGKASAIREGERQLLKDRPGVPRLTQMSSCVKTTLAMALDRCRAVLPSPSP